MGVDTSAYITIALAAVLVYGTRIAGTELMTLFRITPMVEAILKSMAASVLIAIVASEIADGGLRQGVAVLVAAAVMVVSRSAFAAMAAGIAIAASYSWIYG